MELRAFGTTMTFLLVSAIFTAVYSQSCTKINSCSCTYGSDQVVDLSALEGNPKYPDQYDPQYLSMYSWNPCKAFTEGGCTNVAVCQFDGANYYECGTQDSATFTNDPTSGNLILTYTSPDGSGFTRTSQVTLTCDQSAADTLTVSGESTTGLYLFELKSPHCCPKAGPGPSPSGGGGSSGGISPGSIIVIIFFSLIIAYFVFGALFLKYGRQAQGADVVPNRTFWGALPGLVKDGTLSVVRRGKGSYNEI